MEDLEDGWVSAELNPEQATAVAAAATSVTSTEPKIDSPTDGPVTLPGGFRRLEGGQFVEVRTAWVRELTGEDEERIARVMAKPDAGMNALVSTLLECGVERLGDRPATADELKNLLVGDRDYLLLEISAATYGEDVDFTDFECYRCGGKVSFSVRLHEDVPVKRIKELSEQQFEVPLRRGLVATVRLPSGVEAEMISSKDLTVAEGNSALLDKIIIEIKDAKGNPVEVDVLAMGIPDRQKIIQTVGEKAPGPRYNEITFTHEECGNEVVVPFGLMSLFPGLA